MLIQARDTESGEIVWAIGDDHVCAVTRADFIRNRSVEYNDVLIREFPYRDNTPESVGEWKPLILELVKHTLDAYINHEGFVHVYPQWLPEGSGDAYAQGAASGQIQDRSCHPA